MQPSQGEYKVQLEVFEGPLDLLWYLIRKDEIDIYAISLERITQQYLEYLNDCQTLDVDLASDFMVMAANLIFWKSQTLLPEEVEAENSPEEDVDPRLDLIRQLLEYKKFKDAAQFLQLQQAGGSLIPRQIEALKPRSDAKTFAQVSVYDLVQAFQKVLYRFEDKHLVREIIDDRFTVESMMEQLLQRLPMHEEVALHEIFATASGRMECVVIFLAMLELMKMHYLQACQPEVLGEIFITKVDLRPLTAVIMQD